MKIDSAPRRRERRKKMKKVIFTSISLPLIAAGTFFSIELFGPSGEIPNEYKDHAPVVEEIENTFSGSMEGVMESRFGGRIREGEILDGDVDISNYMSFKSCFYREGSWDIGTLEKCFSLENLHEFKYPDEIGIIIYTASRIDVKPSLLLAIRQAEGGEQGKEFGILPEAMPYEIRRKYYDDTGIEENGNERSYISRFPGDTLEKQAAWSAWTVKKNWGRYVQSGGDPNDMHAFIDFLADRYAPEEAENDPHGLNKYWEGNVLKLLHRYSTEY